jgi:hypothetical protein
MSSNPPPSLPPSAPLPPVPGPSPIIDQDTLLLLSTSTRSRRSFKLGDRESGSTSPAPSTLDSGIISNGSTGKEGNGTSYAYSVSTYGVNGRRESVASVRSTRSFSGSSSSLRASTPGGGRLSPSVPSISEKEEMAARRPPPVIRTSPQHLSDIDDNEGIIDIDVVPPSTTRSPRVPRGRTKAMEHGANDSITSIDIKDLRAAMGLGEDDGDGVGAGAGVGGEGDSDSGAPSRPPRVIRRVSARLSGSNIVPQEKSRTEEDERSSSPDIKSIISATPRRRSRRPSSNYSDASSSLSHSQSRSSMTMTTPAATTTTTTRGGQRRRRSDVVPTLPPSAFRTSLGGRASDVGVGVGYDGGAETELWDEDSFVEDYGTQVVRDRDRDDIGIGIGDDDDDQNHHPEIDEVVASLDLGLGMDHHEHRFDRMGDDGGSDSDSSLDLHTPLP